MRVTICSDSGYPYRGGGETYVQNVGSRLVELGNEVNWLISRMPNTPPSEILDGISIQRVPVFGKYLFPGRHTYAFTSILPAIKLAKRSDIVQFNAFIAAINGWAVGKLSNKPYLAMVYEVFQDLWKKMSTNPIERTLYPFLERYITKMPYPKILTISNYVKNSLVSMGVDSKIVEVIYLGIDPLFHTGHDPALKKLFPDKQIIGWGGRFNLTQSKNLTGLLDAFQIVKKEMPNTLLAFDGPNFETFLPEIKKRGLENDIFYNGVSSKQALPSFYASLDLYAMPSLSEGFGLAAVEAQACGTPVVCFNRGSLPEVVSNGETGIIIDEVSSEKLAETMIKLLNDKASLEKMSSRAPEFVKMFDWNKTVERHVSIYQELISSW